MNYTRFFMSCKSSITNFTPFSGLSRRGRTACVGGHCAGRCR
jgi:hypothetical protein